ncbi:FkbM family methyltransferase [Candidatus Bathyarchaeota archaeon A05DMB-2]|nr:FkbM family methyltransferase [Candidatus Bathyarchaeota archaeon A05DMB-2]
MTLLRIAVFQSVPGTLQKLLDFDSSKDKIIEALWKSVVIKSDGIRYALVDHESFEIINESESYVSLWLEPVPGDVIVDIGAHVGKYTLRTAQLVGDKGAVLAVEANPDNYRVLRKNLELNSICNVIALNLAAWNKDCTLKLFIGHVGGHHSAKIDWKRGWYAVRARPMDDVIKEFAVSRVDWIKVDVEGAEWEVLSGLKNTINEYNAKIIIELAYENIANVKNFVRDCEYGIVKISSTFESVIHGVSRKYAYFLLLSLHI